MEVWENTQIEDLKGEIWKPVKGYEGHYEVSNKGRVKSLARKTRTWTIKKSKILKLKKLYTGYIQVKFSINSIFKHPLLGPLVAEAFLKKPSYKVVVNHKNSIRWDNRVENLEWCTQSQNMRHAFKFGNHSQKGEKNNAAKITMELVKEIRKYKEENDHLSQKEIGEKFGLNREHIKDIINYKTWNY